MLNALLATIEDVLAAAAEAYGFTAEVTVSAEDLGLDFGMFEVASTPRPAKVVHIGEFAYRARSTEAWSRGAA